jgi:hypothetical protein
MLADVSTLSSVPPQLGSSADDAETRTGQKPDQHEQRQRPERPVGQPTQPAPEEKANGVEHPDAGISHRARVTFPVGLRSVVLARAGTAHSEPVDV